MVIDLSGPSRNEQVVLYLAHENLKGCEGELQKVKSGCSPGLFICPCTRVFVHVCDEAEGCSWELRAG